MQRACDFCGTHYTAQRSTSKFCSSSCRGRNSASGGKAKVTELPKLEGHGSVTEATQRTLVEAGRLDGPLGQVALALAARLDDPRGDTGSALAAVAKQLSATLGDATAGAKVEEDPVDEMRAARERKRRAAAG